MKHIYLFLLFVVFCTISLAQHTTLKWDYHLSKQTTIDVVKADTKVYFVSSGGIYFYNISDNSISTLTKINGLSGSDFKGIQYSPGTGSLVVYYQNSMVDVIKSDGSIHPISDINRKQIIGDKQIYSARCHKNLCYLACGFGIVVLNLDRLEISDSFIIGDRGQYVAVHDVAVDDENIYAATPNGIRYANIDAPNLLDYSYWNTIENGVLDSMNINMLEFAGDKLWAINQNGSEFPDRVFSRNTEQVWEEEHLGMYTIEDFRSNENSLVLAGRNSSKFPTVEIHNTLQGQIQKINGYSFMNADLRIDPVSAIADNGGNVWIADKNYGGVRLSSEGYFYKIVPEGPVDNGAFDLHYSDGKLWMAAGGYTLSWGNIYNQAIIQGLSNNTWECFDKYSHPQLENIRDVVQIVARPNHPNHIFVATWGYGILEFNNGEFIEQYNINNSPLQTVFSGNYVRIGGIDFDEQGNMWVTNCEVEKQLHKRSPDGKWTSYTLPEIANGYNVGKPLVASTGDIWIIVPRGLTYGLYIMSPDGKNHRHLDVTNYYDNNIEDPLKVKMNNVFDIAEDKDGNIWVGTSKGAAYYSNIDRVFTKEEYYAIQPGVDQNDGIYHPLLQLESVTSVLIDGGNRKYFGTRNSGIYLISEDGREELAHYTQENSDLISNNILSMEYDGDKGVLYVGTDLGLVSLTTESKKAFDSFTEVYAYPNPVPSGYMDNIFISGMMEDTNVKITTISGRLVYETTSIGGQAIWNGRDLSGRRVHTGIYLVFCASPDGAESAVTKIAFIR